MDLGLEFTIPLDLRAGLGVTGSGSLYASPGSPESELYKKVRGCPSDTVALFTTLESVPASRKVATTCSGPINGQWCSYRDEYPQANLLQAVAEDCTFMGNHSGALAVLEEHLKLVSHVKPEDQTEYLAMAADMFLRLEDKENAMRVVKQGFVVANTLLDQDMVAPRLKDVPKEVWSAAETYRRMITLGVNASYTSTLAMVQQIADPALREYEEVMMARALLGVPVRRYFTMFANSGYSVGEVDVGYDRY